VQVVTNKSETVYRQFFSCHVFGTFSVTCAVAYLRVNQMTF